MKVTNPKNVEEDGSGVQVAHSDDGSGWSRDQVRDVDDNHR